MHRSGTPLATMRRKIVDMDIIGKYLRLRRELLTSSLSSPEPAPRRRRLAEDLVRAGAEVEAGKPDQAPFLETMPWSDTLDVTYEHQPGMG
jgi:hypothetical protein